MMKSLSLKKITSSSIAFLTAISSLIGLNSAKVAAMPGAFEHQIRIPSGVRENVIFTIEDMNNLIRNIDRLPRTTAIARTPNFKNLTKVDPNVNHWLGAVQVYLDITEEIIDENLDENLTEEEIEEVGNTYVLVIGNTLNEIRQVRINNTISQEVKKQKYLEIVKRFLNSKSEIIKYAKKRLQGKLEKINIAKNHLMKMLEMPSDLNFDKKIADLEKIIDSADEPEIKTMAQITLNIFKAKKNLASVKTNQDSIKKEKIMAEEKIEKLTNQVAKNEEPSPAEKKEYLEIMDRYEDLIKAQIQSKKNEKAATEALIEAIDKLDAIARIPQKMLIEEIKTLG